MALPPMKSGASQEDDDVKNWRRNQLSPAYFKFRFWLSSLLLLVAVSAVAVAIRLYVPAVSWTPKFGYFFQLCQQLGAATVVVQMVQAGAGLNNVVCAACDYFNKEPAEVWAAVFACEKVLQRGGLFGLFERKGNSSSSNSK
jgi:hypothetical protein